jgi:hypothetical protein
MPRREQAMREELGATNGVEDFAAREEADGGTGIHAQSMLCISNFRDCRPSGLLKPSATELAYRPSDFGAVCSNGGRRRLCLPFVSGVRGLQGLT